MCKLIQFRTLNKVFVRFPRYKLQSVMRVFQNSFSSCFTASCCSISHHWRFDIFDDMHMTLRTTIIDKNKMTKINCYHSWKPNQIHNKIRKVIFYNIQLNISNNYFLLLRCLSTHCTIFNTYKNAFTSSFKARLVFLGNRKLVCCLSKQQRQEILFGAFTGPVRKAGLDW